MKLSLLTILNVSFLVVLSVGSIHEDDYECYEKVNQIVPDVKINNSNLFQISWLNPFELKFCLNSEALEWSPMQTFNVTDEPVVVIHGLDKQLVKTAVFQVKELKNDSIIFLYSAFQCNNSCYRSEQYMLSFVPNGIKKKSGESTTQITKYKLLVARKDNYQQEIQEDFYPMPLDSNASSIIFHTDLFTSYLMTTIMAFNFLLKIIF